MIATTLNNFWRRFKTPLYPHAYFYIKSSTCEWIMWSSKAPLPEISPDRILFGGGRVLTLALRHLFDGGVHTLRDSTREEHFVPPRLSVPFRWTIRLDNAVIAVAIYLWSPKSPTVPSSPLPLIIWRSIPSTVLYVVIVFPLYLLDCCQLT
jgi:hypothetical protein